MDLCKPVSDYKVHGKVIDFARIRQVDDKQGIVICDLLTADGRLLAADRYFFLDKAPFDISGSDRAALGVPPISSGLPTLRQAQGRLAGMPASPPDESWRRDDIIAWMEQEEIPFSKGDTKAVLLEKIAEGAGSDQG